MDSREISQTVFDSAMLEPLDGTTMMDLLEIRANCDDQMFTPFFGNKYTQDEWYKKVSADPTQLILTMVCPGNAWLHVMGYIRLFDIDHLHKTCGFGIAIGEEYRGRGLGTRFTKEALEIAFSKLGMQKVWLEVFTDNGAAVHIYKKCGFKIEGTMRNQYWKNGRWKDTYRMGVFNPKIYDVIHWSPGVQWPHSCMCSAPVCNEKEREKRSCPEEGYNFYGNPN